MNERGDKFSIFKFLLVQSILGIPVIQSGASRDRIRSGKWNFCCSKHWEATRGITRAAPRKIPHAIFSKVVLSRRFSKARFIHFNGQRSSRRGID